MMVMMMMVMRTTTMTMTTTIMMMMRSEYGRTWPDLCQLFPPQLLSQLLQPICQSVAWTFLFWPLLSFVFYYTYTYIKSCWAIFQIKIMHFRKCTWRLVIPSSLVCPCWGRSTWSDLNPLPNLASAFWSLSSSLLVFQRVLVSSDFLQLSSQVLVLLWRCWLTIADKLTTLLTLWIIILI